jgi:hypothetical protein
VPSRVSNQFREYPWCELSINQNSINNRDALQSDRIRSSEGQELNVDGWELDVELAEVANVFLAHLLNELGGQKLVFKGNFRGFKDGLEGV